MRIGGKLVVKARTVELVKRLHNLKVNKKWGLYLDFLIEALIRPLQIYLMNLTDEMTSLNCSLLNNKK